MKSLPTGISTLKTIIEADMVYIDKTPFAYDLIKVPGRYFLARPRRFGKSLFVDTLKEIFTGNKKLFTGLYIYDKWDWDKKYPVIKIDFTGGTISSKDDLDNKLNAVFNGLARTHQLCYEEKGHANKLNELIIKMSEKYQSRMVVLVDEYDKPLLDNLENTPIAEEIRTELKSLYSALKEQDANLQFIFLTGVSKFSKVNIFSGINNLTDITIDRHFGDICGYTQEDLDTSFAEHLRDVNREKLKKWYNGYCFLGQRVYNPYDILLFIQKGKTYHNYWFETGTPTFLISLFQKNNYFIPDLSNIMLGEDLINSFDIEQIEPETLLFQTGYLTIEKTLTKFEKTYYKLTYPNLEVKMSLNEYLINAYTKFSKEKIIHQEETYRALLHGDLPGLEKSLRRLFAAIPWRNFTNNRLPDFEGYYASVLYAFFAAMNCEIIPEDINNRGQADMTVMLGDNIYIMEVKVLLNNNDSGDTHNKALEQIINRGYAEKYRGIQGKKVYQVGMVFSGIKRNLTKYNWAELSE